MRTLVCTILLLVSVAACAAHHERVVASNRYRVFFPPIKLASADGERIDSIEITMSRGRFRAIGMIPNDWSVEVVSPMSEKTVLRANAGHGSSALWSVGDLDGSITVSVEEASCFDIVATVGTTETEHHFTRSDLILEP